MKNPESIRLWLFFPVLKEMYEVVLPLRVSLRTCIPFLNELFAAEFAGRYQLNEKTVFVEMESNLILSSTVTLLHQNLWEGMRLAVY